MKAILYATAVWFLSADISTVQATMVVIPANSLWTDTHLNVIAGEQLSFTAAGSWILAQGWPWSGPDGVSETAYSFDAFLASANHGSLIAFVGTDPYQGHWGDGSFFPQVSGYWNIGSSAQFISDKTGELWLGLNDDAVSMGTWDNAGSMTAEIVITPEPATLVLIGLGGMLLRKRK